MEINFAIRKFYLSDDEGYIGLLIYSLGIVQIKFPYN